ncbi:MAG: signal recognition particle-docking protein FtsY [Kiritimatiellae bacterium]|jgi:fused signal recognition particle receptor|nr:signal recognition particle-docking protein FtsY [Kiritimatiellia bacterium]
MVQWFKALSKTRSVLSSALQGMVSDGTVVDERTLEQLEMALLRADLPPRLVAELVMDLEENQVQGNRTPVQVLKESLAKELLFPKDDPLNFPISPACILLLGVNGAGKTTTCAKLAWRAKQAGRKVMLGAADTFRAAGTEQLRLWGESLDVPVVSGRQGSDASAVAFDAMDAAHARGVELLFIDTAGRMHTKDHLMDELQKMVRAIKKRDDQAPHATWMVLDASLGQNSLNQARIFHQAVPLSGLILTKLDGSSKAGFLFNIQKEMPGVPVLFSGLGEAKEDLVPFDPDSFLDGLLQASPDENDS